MRKIIITLSALIGIVMWSCSDTSTEPSNSTETPYLNLNDSTTKEIVTSIPSFSVDDEGEAELLISVTDQDGMVIDKLNSTNFRVTMFTELQSKQELWDSVLVNFKFNTFSSSGKTISAALTMDYSGSMSDYDVDLMEEAGKGFVRNKSLEDRICIVKYDENVDIVCPFTADTLAIMDAIDSSYSRGMTALWLSTKTALDETIKEDSNVMKSVICFTDGLDNSSGAVTLNEVVDFAKNNYVSVYTIGYGSSPDETSLQFLAEKTGGRYFRAQAKNLSEIYELISGQVQGGYQLEWDVPEGKSGYFKVETTYQSQTGEHYSVVNLPFGSN